MLLQTTSSVWPGLQVYCKRVEIVGMRQVMADERLGYSWISMMIDGCHVYAIHTTSGITRIHE